jgi:hypothetical protein
LFKIFLQLQANNLPILFAQLSESSSSSTALGGVKAATTLNLTVADSVSFTIIATLSQQINTDARNITFT